MADPIKPLSEKQLRKKELKLFTQLGEELADLADTHKELADVRGKLAALTAPAPTTDGVPVAT